MDTADVQGKTAGATVATKPKGKSDPFRLASRQVWSGQTVVDCDGVKLGGHEVVLIAGPCTVENLDMLLTAARAAKAAGAAMLRGGAFKPRSSPYSFQGLGEEGLAMLAEARRQTGLRVVTEVMEPEQVGPVAAHADMLQIGTRSMSNFSLLKEVGRQRKPVMLKRGMMSTLSEWLQAAEYIMTYGNTQVVLCERGIRTFETYTRNTLDLSVVPAVKAMSHLPVMIDPSHGTGRGDLVTPMAMAAVAAGADAVMVEVHPEPAKALCDGGQSLDPCQLVGLAERLAAVAGAVGRRLYGPVDR